MTFFEAKVTFLNLTYHQQIVATLADMLLNSTFQPDAIEREKKTILQVSFSLVLCC